MDWIALTESITSAVKAAFSNLIRREDTSTIYAFILYTDADCYTVLPSANSIERHEEKIAREGIVDASEIAGYKWSIGEWTYEAWMPAEFEAICRELSAASQEAYQQGTFSEYRERVHASMIGALSSLDEEGFFAAARDHAVLFISSSDHDESMEMENMSAQILNPPSMYAEFLRRYES